MKYRTPIRDHQISCNNKRKVQQTQLIVLEIQQPTSMKSVSCWLLRWFGMLFWLAEGVMSVKDKHSVTFIQKRSSSTNLLGCSRLRKFMLEFETMLSGLRGAASMKFERSPELQLLLFADPEIKSETLTKILKLNMMKPELHIRKQSKTKKKKIENKDVGTRQNGDLSCW